jgi:hypothetical protein
MLPAATFSVSIECDWQALYEHIWRPEFFPKWASGLSESDLHEEDGAWVATGAECPVSIRFTAHNAYGVMDHFVDLGGGNEVHIPLRVIQNGDGAEVLLTLYRQSDMDDKRFAADAEWVKRDLTTLKRLIEEAR